MSKHMSPRIADLLQTARYNIERSKQAFVDPATMGGGGDPAAAAGGAPMDPAMMGGGDPAAMAGGGAPPPPAAPPSGPDPLSAIMDKLNQLSAGGGGGAGGESAAIKPKIDVNVEIMQIKNILAKIADALGIQIPAQDMVATPEKLTAMAQGQSTSSDPAAGGGGGGATSAIPPIQPMGAAGPGMGKQGGLRGTGDVSDGVAYDGSKLMALSGKAAAMALVMSRRAG